MDEQGGRPHDRAAVILDGASRFDGRVAVVTGASRGLGAVIAELLAKRGAKVALNWVTSHAAGTALVEKLRATGVSAVGVPFDVRDERAVEAGLSRVEADLGPIEVLINNAGIAGDGLFALQDADTWRDAIAVNLDGTRHCCRAVVRGMVARRRGSIVNVVSAAGLRGATGQSAYAAAKAGVISLTRTLAAELAPRGIRVNAVAPGLLDVGMAMRTDRDAVTARLRHVPLARVGTGLEAAEVVAFLASDAAAYVVGQVVAVDGGATL